METEKTTYPHLTISKIKNPNRVWAFPVLGGLVKIIILIPVFIEIALLMFYAFLLQIINSFHILFSDKYLPYCFNLTCGTYNLVAKTTFFFSGLSDKYPGFDLKQNEDFELKFILPNKPRAIFAFPIFGGIARAIMIIPFAIYTQVITNGARIGTIGSSIPVLLNGRYPDSTYELTTDAVRLNLRQMAYFAGISDIYPSFKINMNNQTIKIFLIIIGTILVFSQWRVNRKEDRLNNDINRPQFMQNMPNRTNPQNYQYYR